LAAGIVVSFGGAIVVGISEVSGGRNSVIGVVLCLVAAVCYAAGVVCQKAALRHASAVQVTTFGCMAGTAACLPFAGQLVSQLGSAPVSATLNVVYRSRADQKQPADPVPQAVPEPEALA
jgi:drug/metabolite transporter (DMT)-like permease